MNDLSPIEWAILPLKKYATFSGRAPRAEYWWYYLATVIVGIPIGFLDRVLGTGQLFAGIFDLALLLPWLSVSVRRLHDTDRSGWWFAALLGALIGDIALFGVMSMLETGTDANRTPLGFTSIIAATVVLIGAAITLIVFMVLPGTEGMNRYGPDPYGPSDLEEVFA